MNKKHTGNNLNYFLKDISQGSAVSETIKEVCKDKRRVLNEKKIRKEFHDCIWKLASLNLRPGTKKILNELNRRYDLLVASDTTGIAPCVIKKFNLRVFFKKMFFSHKVGHLKNEGAFWEYLLSQFSSSSSEFLVIGDNPATDIRVPNKFGMKTILVSSSVSQNEGSYTAEANGDLHEKPDHEIKDLKELLDLIK